jgi:hypothetical protein
MQKSVLYKELVLNCICGIIIKVKKSNANITAEYFILALPVHEWDSEG